MVASDDLVRNATATSDSNLASAGQFVRRLMAEFHSVQSNDLEIRRKEREVFAFEWRGSIWFPMFQFEPSDWSIRPGVGAICQALPHAASNWEIAFWFATSNSMLQDQSPANMLATNLPDVLEAAGHAGRTERKACAVA